MAAGNPLEHKQRDRSRAVLRAYELCESRGGIYTPDPPKSLIRAQELCESRRGRPGLLGPNSPYGLCERKASFELERAVQLKKERKRKKEKRNRMTASVLKQDSNTKRFKRTLIYLNTDTQYTHFRGNPLYQATKRHLNNRQTVKNDEKLMKKTYLVLVEFLQLVRCLEDSWKSDFPESLHTVCPC